MLPLCLMGLTEAELTALASEGQPYMENKMMDPKLRSVTETVLGAVGAVMVYMGVTDDATWMQWSGGLMTMLALVMPYVMPAK